jgi:diguanylate cyclase (GGDEF)-like protein
LASGSSFCASYCDLNHFKAFNDQFGYWQGDKMIRLLASIITQECDGQRDFAGHIGGDDFIVLLQSEDWENRCRRMVEQFNCAAPALYDSRARDLGYIESEDRQGNSSRFPLTTLSIGALQVAAGEYISAEDVATAAASAKHQAKRSNMGLFILDANRSGRGGGPTLLRASA